MTRTTAKDADPRTPGERPVTSLQTFGIVIVAYMLAHGLTAWLITPVQALLLPDVTAFASLVYLPHGVRVLATWLLGPIAFVPLALWQMKA